MWIRTENEILNSEYINNFSFSLEKSEGTKVYAIIHAYTRNNEEVDIYCREVENDKACKLIRLALEYIFECLTDGTKGIDTWECFDSIVQNLL